MPHYFRRIVPILEDTGTRITTEFVLTPGSKSLRRTLQGELEMTALGIHPHILRHRESGITRSEISAVKLASLDPQPATIMQELEPLFRIVQEQLTLPEPNVASSDRKNMSPRFNDTYEEVVVSATDLVEQQQALTQGYQAVGYDPKANTFKMAIFPQERPDLGFILNNEAIEPNKRLVHYLNNHLYQQAGNMHTEGGTIYAD